MLATADTIVAIATPPGEGGVGIVRLSGPRALEVGRALVRPARRTTWPSPRLIYGHVVDEASGRRVDEVLAVYMAAPHTYTAEDVFEIHCHGGPAPLGAVVELALRHGARPAGRGEFTLRAFLNGRLDLSQAEAVLEMGGAGIPAAACETLLARLGQAEEGLQALLATARHGIILREGLRAVLAGAPNVGKSSLLNRPLRADRALLTPVAGTTRDTVEEPANIGDLPVYLVDTAGLTQSDDPVEQLGVQRSRSAIAAADLLLLVADAARPLDERDREAFGTARALAPDTPRS